MVAFIKKILNERKQERQAEQDRRQELIELVNNSYKSLRVVGRGSTPRGRACLPCSSFPFWWPASWRATSIQSIPTSCTATKGNIFT